MKKTQMHRILNTFKHYVGMSDWKIIISNKSLETSSGFAGVETDYYEKEANIKLSKSFFKLNFEKQRNVLIHELVHGRVQLFKKKCDTIISEEEEFLVNDLVRGFECMKVEHKKL